MKKFILFFILLLANVALFAQDSTGGGSGGGGFTLSPTIVFILSLLLGVYEVVIRLIPTVKNYSIIGWIIKLIQTVLPNKSTTGEKHP